MVCDLVLEEASSDNMGNNECKDGVLPAKEGTSLTKFPIVGEERVAFLLYHMNIIPRATTDMPTITNRGKMILGDRLERIVFIYVINNVVKHIHRHRGVTVTSCSFSVLISVSVSVSEFEVIPHKNIACISIVKTEIKKE